MRDLLPRLRVLLIICSASIFLIVDASGQSNEQNGANAVVATTDNPSNFIGKSVHRISQEDISNIPSYSVVDWLNTLPGVHMGGAFGTPGTALSYNIRGGRNRQVLVLIDGIPMNDPSSISNEYDLRLPDISMVHEIELLKGVSSTLFGTGAVTAVINIKLRESESGKAKYSFSESFGSFLTSNTTARVEGRSFRLGYVASTSLGISRGFSAADEGELAVTFGDDGYLKSSSRVKLVVDKSEDVKEYYNLAFDYLRSGYDDGPFLDAENQFRLKQLNLSFGSNGKLRKGRGTGTGSAISLATNTPNPFLLGNSLMGAISSSLGPGRSKTSMSLNVINRDYESAMPANSTGLSVNINRESNRTVKNWLTWIAGSQTQVNTLRDQVDDPLIFVFSYYHQLAIRLFRGFYINGGVRPSLYKTFRDINLVYNVNPVYAIPLGSDNTLKLYASYATGFIAPTIIQRTAPRFGNGSLDPEKSASWEFGTSLYLGEGFTLNLEYFNREEDQAIDLVTLYDEFGNRLGAIYRNIEGKRAIEGIEADMSFDVGSALSFSAHFAKYQFNDPSRFYKIPDTKYGLKAMYKIGANTRLALNYSYFGERRELNPAETATVALDGFDVVDASFVHEIKGPDLVVSGAVKNLLNADFVNIYGFKSRPINFDISIAVKF